MGYRTWASRCFKGIVSARRCSPGSTLPPSMALSLMTALQHVKQLVAARHAHAHPSYAPGLFSLDGSRVCENVCYGLTFRWFACCDDAYSVMSLRMISLTRASSPAAASCLTRCSTSRAASLRRSYLRDRAQQQCNNSVAACTHVAACVAAMHDHLPCKKRSRCCFSQFVAYLAQHRLRQQLLGDHHGDVPCCCDHAADLR